MFRKYIALMLVTAFMLCFVAAQAENGALPSDDVFYSAKAAVKLISERNIEKAIETLNAKAWLSAKTLRQNIETNCRRIYGMNVQDKYAVAWRKDGQLFMAIPLEEPSDGYVDTVVFMMSDGYEVTQVGFVKWADVLSELDVCRQVRWCDEYKPSYRVFVD